jgi:uncharacterized protein YgfB (UPF0149 family)
MSEELVDTRVIEICEGEWIAQFMGGFGWTQLGDDVFDTRADAQAYLDDQIDSADLDS